ncbi:MAG: XRE family transcriptional regulator [Chloroflexota bacterium]
MNDPIAKNLQSIRKEQSLSLDKLAELTGVSKSMLRQIETGKSSPTIATLWKVANGLRIPLTALLREENPEVIQKRFDEGTPIIGNSEGHRLLSLIPFDPDRSFEIYHIEIDTDAMLESEPHNGIPEEHIFVTQGCITLTIDNQLYKVEQDQFIRFRANRPHTYTNVGDQTARAIILIAYLSNEIK